jgi:hypothetical protein
MLADRDICKNAKVFRKSARAFAFLQEIEMDEDG